MQSNARILRGVCVALFVLVLGSAARGAELLRREWTIDGARREALLHLPSRGPANGADGAPVVFAFHGHGGNMRQAARSQPLHEAWPEALVVFMQGVPTPGRLTDPEGKRNGWQSGAGDQGDRDLKFFDAVLRSLQADYRVDSKRIYATGHSNGGGFTYLLWAERPDVFAAFGPSASLAPRGHRDLAPRPVIHVAGENDPLVKFEWQKAMIELLRRNNACGEGQPAGRGLTLYPSKLDAPVMTYIHPGTHQYPSAAPAVIVEFFKQHAKK